MLQPAPQGTRPATAAGIFVAGLTASLILGNVGQVAEGDTVFIPSAAGGVGSYAVQIARLLGAGAAAKREAGKGIRDSRMGVHVSKLLISIARDYIRQYGTS